ncbi:MAG: hypothetical protein H0X35_10080 [Pseudonocardiales bacterium]|nr:hypothetical protein [Pseudonocardiales bacterium]
MSAGYAGIALTDQVRAAGARLGSASSTGRPYIQFRGGLPGFVRTLDEHTE